MRTEHSRSPAKPRYQLSLKELSLSFLHPVLFALSTAKLEPTGSTLSSGARGFSLRSVFFPSFPTLLGGSLSTSSPTAHQRISLFLQLFLSVSLEARRSSNKSLVFLSSFPFRLGDFSPQLVNDHWLFLLSFPTGLGGFSSIDLFGSCGFSSPVSY